MKVFLFQMYVFCPDIHLIYNLKKKICKSLSKEGVFQIDSSYDLIQQ